MIRQGTDVTTATSTGRKQRRSSSEDVSSLGLTGRGRYLPYAFNVPAFLLVSAILVYPVLYAIYRSLFRADNLGDPEVFVGFGNYADMFTDPAFFAALRRSLVFAFGCVLLGTVLALMFAFALNRVLRRLRFIRALTIAPYIVSSVAAAVMFRILFNPDAGQVNHFFELIGLDRQPWLSDPGLAMVVVIVAQVWTDLPLAVLLLLGGLQTIDTAYLDAALVDGAGPWERARHVSIPLIAPQLAISTVWLSYATLTSFGVILALTGGGPLNATQTLPIEVYITAFQDLQNNQALAIVTVILVLNAIFTLAYVRAARRYQAVEA